MTSSTLPLGQRIKAVREEKKLSHDRLAEKVGTSRQHLIRIEKGVHNPRPGMLARISEALETPFSVEQTDDDDEESQAVTDLAHALLHALRRVKALA